MKISKPQVLSSANGYYIGTLAYDDNGDCLGPYERLSGYYHDYSLVKLDLDNNNWI